MGGAILLGRVVYLASQAGEPVTPHLAVEAVPRPAPRPREAPGTPPAAMPAASIPTSGSPPGAGETPPAREARRPQEAPVDLLAGGRSRAPAGDPARKASRPARARVAIIIDDVGHDLGPVELASKLPFRLTFAVIPYLAHSRASAELLNARGYQVMMHLPMEPLGYPQEDPGRGAVLHHMDPDEIRTTVLQDLAAVPYARGVNNHMGSRITADPQRMRTVLEAIRSSPLYFIDSRTSGASVAHAVAQELRVPSAERSVFLDDVPERKAVEKQVHRLIRIALERGSAIAIGHPYPVTLDALARELPHFARAGVEVVFASELVL